jgi:hypothetical protein
MKATASLANQSGLAKTCPVGIDKLRKHPIRYAALQRHLSLRFEDQIVFANFRNEPSGAVIDLFFDESRFSLRGSRGLLDLVVNRAIENRIDVRLGWVAEWFKASVLKSKWPISLKAVKTRYLPSFSVSIAIYERSYCFRKSAQMR